MGSFLLCDIRKPGTQLTPLPAGLLDLSADLWPCERPIDKSRTALRSGRRADLGDNLVFVLRPSESPGPDSGPDNSV